jgi:hypothetical protein
MDRTVFRERLHQAAILARDSARGFIEETLPDDIRFQLQLNSSHDAGCSDVFRLFPEDSDRDVHLARMTLDGAVDELWRDGMIPQWIDIAVVGETEDTTLLHGTCCGRFTSDDELLYHQHSGIPPFHVTGPVLPINHIDGIRFSIYNRAHCWNAVDLARASRHAEKIWSLELFGPAFDDAILAALPGVLQHVEILELNGTGIDGGSLDWLKHAPRLRVLRLASPLPVVFNFARLPVLSNLTYLSIATSQLEVRGPGEAGASCPILTDLTIAFDRDVTERGQVELLAVSTLSVTGPSFPAWLQSLRPSTVHIHCRGLSPQRVSTVLDAMRTTLDSVDLRGTPVDDSIFEHLAQVDKLRYVDLVDTGISQAALERFVAQRPGLKHWPRTRAG